MTEKETLCLGCKIDMGGETIEINNDSNGFGFHKGFCKDCLKYVECGLNVRALGNHYREKKVIGILRKIENSDERKEFEEYESLKNTVRQLEITLAELRVEVQQLKEKNEQLENQEKELEILKEKNKLLSEQVGFYRVLTEMKERDQEQELITQIQIPPKNSNN